MATMLTLLIFYSVVQTILLTLFYLTVSSLNKKVESLETVLDRSRYELVKQRIYALDDRTLDNKFSIDCIKQQIEELK